MREIQDITRFERLVRRAIQSFELDLKGMKVCTEAASGPFICTPLIAALSRADKVYAVTRDSAFGTAEEVEGYLWKMAKQFEITDGIELIKGDWLSIASEVNVVTNLGFVRPIHRERIMRLPSRSAIALMWEPWEFRSADIDIVAASERGIPVVGTNEGDPRLQTMRFVGLLALKLLLERDIEVLNSKIAVVGSDPFGGVIEQTLASLGAEVFRVNPKQDPGSMRSEKMQKFLQSSDAIVLAEHNDHRPLISEGSEGIHVDSLRSARPLLIHICGALDMKLLEEYSIEKFPTKQIAPGFMSLTTDYVGPKPVIDLHAAGLKTAAEAVRGLDLYGNPRAAIDYCLKASPSLPLTQLHYS